MVLVRELSEAEKKRHSELICYYARMNLDVDHVDSELIGYGNQKGVYKITSNRKRWIVAAGVSRDKDALLEQDYVVLRALNRTVPHFFPKAIAHFTTPDEVGFGDMMIMSYINRPNLADFKRQQVPGTLNNQMLAFTLGRDLTTIYLKSGRYSSEPHDENILIGIKDGVPDLKFCDAIQYLPGTLEDVARSVFSYGDCRRECISFAPRFKEGMVVALMAHNSYSRQDAENVLPFLRKYSSIL